MHKKVVSVGSRMWMRMSFSKLFRGFPTNSVRLIQYPLGFCKRCQEWFLPFVKSMVNLSFSEGIVPKSWKSAQITPLLKRPSLDHNVVSSYRPISNLPVLSKLSEWLVLNRVMSYLNNLNILPHPPISLPSSSFH